MMVLYARPNTSSYTESVTFLTRVFESVNGMMNTKQGMQNFYYKCRYSATLFYTSRHRAFINLLRDGLVGSVTHPLWGQAAVITTTVLSTTSVPCKHSYSDFRVGDLVFITYGYDSYTTATLVGKGTDVLYIDTPVDISKGSVIIPSFKGIITGQIPTNYTGENYITCELSVEGFR